MTKLLNTKEQLEYLIATMGPDMASLECYVNFLKDVTTYTTDRDSTFIPLREVIHTLSKFDNNAIDAFITFWSVWQSENSLSKDIFINKIGELVLTVRMADYSNPQSAISERDESFRSFRFETPGLYDAIYHSHFLNPVSFLNQLLKSPSNNTMIVKIYDFYLKVAKLSTSVENSGEVVENTVSIAMMSSNEVKVTDPLTALPEIDSLWIISDKHNEVVHRRAFWAKVTNGHIDKTGKKTVEVRKLFTNKEEASDNTPILYPLSTWKEIALEHKVNQKDLEQRVEVDSLWIQKTDNTRGLGSIAIRVISVIGGTCQCVPNFPEAGIFKALAVPVFIHIDLLRALFDRIE